MRVGGCHLEYRSGWRDDGDHGEPVSSERTELPRSAVIRPLSRESLGVTFHERRADGRRGNGSEETADGAREVWPGNRSAIFLESFQVERCQCDVRIG